jgi:quinolinate synthase
MQKDKKVIFWEGTCKNHEEAEKHYKSMQIYSQEYKVLTA